MHIDIYVSDLSSSESDIFGLIYILLDPEVVRDVYVIGWEQDETLKEVNCVQWVCHESKSVFGETTQVFLILFTN